MLSEGFITVAVGLLLLVSRRRCALEASWIHERVARIPLDPGAAEFGFMLGGWAYICVGLLELISHLT